MRYSILVATFATALTCQLPAIAETDVPVYETSLIEHEAKFMREIGEFRISRERSKEAHAQFAAGAIRGDEFNLIKKANAEALLNFNREKDAYQRAYYEFIVRGKGRRAPLEIPADLVDYWE